MTVLLMVALLFYLGGAFYSIILFTTKSEGRNRSLTAIVGIGFLTHLASLFIDWRLSGYFPIINPREVSSFIALSMAGYYLVMTVRYSIRAFPTFILPVVSLFTLVTIALPESGATLSSGLESAITATTFTRVIFPLHVTLIVFSYAAFIITFICGVMYLVQERELKSKHFGAAFQRLPALNTCDDISYRAQSIGFVLLTLGLATGIIWNHQRDGRFWHNDPKEVLALVTWCIYLFIMHYRITAGIRGRKTALLSIAGFVIILITWLGSRSLGGFHVFN